MTLRIPEDLWTRFGEVAQAAEIDRAALLRAFIRWYVKQEGAKLPPRP